MPRDPNKQDCQPHESAQGAYRQNTLKLDTREAAGFKAKV